MTKQSRQDLESLLQSVASYLRTAGVPEQQINVAHGPRYKVHHYAKAFDWLHEFILSEEMEAFKKVWALRPAEVWRNYEMLEIEGLQEQVLLQDASKTLIKRWRVKRPRMFGPDRPVEEEEHGENERRECVEN